MRKRFKVSILTRPLVGASLALAAWLIPLQAEDKIQSFVNPRGMVVFTNLVENPSVVMPEQNIREIALIRDQIPDNIRPLVETISKTYGIDPNLVIAMMKTESNFNRWAVSPKGARGLMQLIPETGRRFGVRDFFDPVQNIEGGIRYLKFLLEKFNGSVELSVAAYNAGENLVERLGRVPPIAETRDYVRKISTLYKNPNALPRIDAPVAETAAAAFSPIYRSVDERGIVHFSNVAPLN